MFFMLFMSLLRITAVVVPLAFVFFASSLIVNCIQLLSLIILRPFSRNLHRHVNRIAVELLASEIICLIDWWAGAKIHLYAEPNTLMELMGKENALLISNHGTDIDWLVGWVMAQRCGCSGTAFAIMKKPLKFLPVIGWTMWLSECLFLDRNWAKDELTLKSGFLNFKDFSRPFWLVLFVEGTRFTSAKLLAAQKYAESAGLPLPRNVLVPRTKGFVSAVRYMRSFVPAIYDFTIAVPREGPCPTILGLLKGSPRVVMHVHIKRHDMVDLPEKDDDIAQWCRDLFVAKDDSLDKFRAENTFGEHLHQSIRRPVKPLLVVLGWVSVILVIASRLLRCALRSWTGVALLTGGTLMFAIVMHVFIVSSQSEHSTPAKAALPKSQ